MSDEVILKKFLEMVLNIRIRKSDDEVAEMVGVTIEELKAILNAERVHE